jgi:hypothetical protein
MMMRTTSLPLKVAVGEKISIFFLGMRASSFYTPHEKNVCIPHAVKQGKLPIAKRESG